MFMISLMILLMILFLSGMSSFMDEHVKKLRLFLKFAMRVLHMNPANNFGTEKPQVIHVIFDSSHRKFPLNQKFDKRQKTF
jgi:hypothetical protein